MAYVAYNYNGIRRDSHPSSHVKRHDSCRETRLPSLSRKQMPSATCQPVGGHLLIMLPTGGHYIASETPFRKLFESNRL